MLSNMQTPDATSVRSREALITAKPQRIPPLTPEEFGEEAHQITAKIMKAASAASVKDVPPFIATMLRHPLLLRPHLDLSIQLFGGTLFPRDRELATLRTAWLCQTPFEWGEHVAIGKRIGLSSAEIERVILGSEAPGWTEHERAIIRAVEELHTQAMVSDETWSVLAQSLDERQVIELLILIGQYHGVAYLMNTLRIRLNPDNSGLSAR